MTESLVKNPNVHIFLKSKINYKEFFERSFLQYIGSKRKLLPFILKYLEGETIVDLMAGTHSLGYFLKDKKRVIANDIMKYSYIIGKALVESSVLKILPLYIENNDKYNFFEKNYSGTYFTLKQCQDLDAIKYSIDKLSEEYLKACYYSCVFNILDRIGTTAGHFDGFLKQNTIKANRRQDKNVIEYFQKEIKKFKNKENKFDSRVFNLDAIDMLSKIERVDTIYIDPPYNHRQYSTLYHILEMFVEYTGKLKKCLYKYPENRYFSPYCYKNGANIAFDNLIKKASEKSNNLVFSYSNKGILSIKKLISIFEKYYDELYKEEIDYYHRKQKTSKGKGIVKEYIFCMKK